MVKSMGEKATGSRGGQPPDEDIQSIGDVLTRRQRERFKTGDKLLGRYRILGELGKGGMGLVFKCMDEVGGIEVAVKMLPPEVSHDTGEMEEIRENFAIVENLHHPNIAALKTLEKDPDTGEYLLIMELAAGTNLRRWRKQRKPETGTLNTETILPVLRQIASALDHAHDRKVVHRDVKPSNVMMGTDGRVKVLDFGLAAQIHTSLSRVSHVRYGTSGTGPYMAPEQWRGQYQDGKTDQYAFAVMVYELLAGRCPFENADAIALREAALKEKPERPAGLSNAAWLALERGLAKNREERFASCGDFVRALGGEKIGTANKREWTRIGKWAATLVLMAALAVGGYWSYTSFQSFSAQKAAQSQAAAEAAKLSAAQQSQVDGLRRDVESALSLGDLKTAGAKLSELESAGGTTSVSSALRRRYEAAAGAQEVRKRYASAKTAYDDAMKLADGQGFKARQKALTEKWLMAERAEKAQAWGEALSGYDAVLTTCRELDEADVSRRDAETQRQKTEAERQKAAKANAAEDARSLFDDGAAAALRAAGSFEKGDFAGASKAWKNAAEIFQTSENRAVAAQAYAAAKTAYEQALGGTTSVSSALLDQYGGADWKTAREQARLGAASADQPEAGRQAYASALAALNQALAEVEKKAAPTLTIEAIADGRAVAATVTAGDQTWPTPTPPLKLEKGKAYAFNVSHTSPSSQGKRWAPATLNLTADWAGPQKRAVALEESRGPTEGQNWRSLATGMEFVWIPALKIWVGKYEVTNGEYRKYKSGHDSQSYGQQSLNGDNQPVVFVNFDDAKEYVEWLTRQDSGELAGARYRLPSEDEWMTFAQCGDGREYPWGNDMPPTYGNYCGQETKGIAGSMISGYNDGHPVTCDVEDSGKNPWGLYGVGGNVWEATASDKSGASFGAWRGASWYDNDPDFLRCSFRFNVGGSNRSNLSGFRLVLSR